MSGKAFLDRWREDTLEPLFTFIKTSMPGNFPGSLDERAYADMLAYILEANGLPAGKRELTPSMVGGIQLVGAEGPRPLANLTIVRAVGCLSAAANNTWALVKAGSPRPVRARIVDGTTPGGAEGLGGSTARHADVSASERHARRARRCGTQGAGEGRADQAEHDRADQRHVARVGGPDVRRVNGCGTFVVMLAGIGISG